MAVAGHSAQVRYAQETVFLSLFDDGWRVTAAGCSRTSTDPSVPYDCTVGGRLMRRVFWGYGLVIVVGLGFCIAMGLTLR